MYLKSYITGLVRKLICELCKVVNYRFCFRISLCTVQCIVRYNVVIYYHILYMISDFFNSTTKFRHNPVLKHCIKGNQPVSGSDITRWNSGRIRYLVIHLIGLPKPADCTNKNGDCKNLRIMCVTHAGGAQPVVCSDRYKPVSGGVGPQCKRRSFNQHKAQGWRSHKHLSQQQAHLLRAD